MPRSTRRRARAAIMASRPATPSSSFVHQRASGSSRSEATTPNHRSPPTGWVWSGSDPNMSSSRLRQNTAKYAASALSTSACPSQPSSRAAPRAASPSRSSSAITGSRVLALASAVSSWIVGEVVGRELLARGDALVEELLDGARPIAEIPVLGEHRAVAAHGVVGRDDVAALGVEHRRELVERDRAAPAVLRWSSRAAERCRRRWRARERFRAPGSRCCRRRRRR